MPTKMTAIVMERIGVNKQKMVQKKNYLCEAVEPIGIRNCSNSDCQCRRNIEGASEVELIG
jgi:hypothetical protein